MEGTIGGHPEHGGGQRDIPVGDFVDPSFPFVRGASTASTSTAAGVDSLAGVEQRGASSAQRGGVAVGANAGVSGSGAEQRLVQVHRKGACRGVSNHGHMFPVVKGANGQHGDGPHRGVPFLPPTAEHQPVVGVEVPPGVAVAFFPQELKVVVGVVVHFPPRRPCEAPTRLGQEMVPVGVPRHEVVAPVQFHGKGGKAGFVVGHQQQRVVGAMLDGVWQLNEPAIGLGEAKARPRDGQGECPFEEGVLNHVRCLVDLRSKYDTQNSNVGAGGFFLNQYPARDRTRDRTSLATARAFSAPLARASSIWALSAMSSWKRARSSANPSTRASSNAFLAWPHP